MLPTGIYLLKVNNKNTRARCKICSKLIVLVSLSLSLNIFTQKKSVSIIGSEQVNAHPVFVYILGFIIIIFTLTFFPSEFLILIVFNIEIESNSCMFSRNGSAPQLMLPSLFHLQSSRRGSDTLDNVACFIM